MTRMIEVLVSPKGDAQIQTKGYAGGDCVGASKFLEQALGIASSDVKTPEFFQTNDAQQQIRQQ